MDLEKMMNRAAILLPALHITTCTLYIYGYTQGFGSSIASLFSISDFFTVTLKNLLVIYITGISFPVLVFITRRQFGEYKKVIADHDANRQEYFTRVYTNIALFAVSFWLQIIFWIFKLRFGITIVSLFVSSLEFFLFIFWHRICIFFKIYGVAQFFFLITVTFCAGVFAQGFDKGISDRTKKFSDIHDIDMTCKNQIILSSVGEKFLSVTEDNTRHLIDKDCKVIFDFKK